LIAVNVTAYVSRQGGGISPFRIRTIVTVTDLETSPRAAANFLWGPPMMLLLIGTGIYLSIGLRGTP
jgi:Na+/alanine symporter